MLSFLLAALLLGIHLFSGKKERNCSHIVSLMSLCHEKKRQQTAGADLDVFTRFCTLSPPPSTEHGGGGGLQREEPQPAWSSSRSAHLISCHLLLVCLLLQLLEEIRHLDLLVVP